MPASGSDRPIGNAPRRQAAGPCRNPSPARANDRLALTCPILGTATRAADRLSVLCGPDAILVNGCLASCERRALLRSGARLSVSASYPHPARAYSQEWLWRPPPPGGTAGEVGRRMSISSKILLIDDDPAIRGFTSLTLEAEGFTVVMAADGAEGLRRVRDDAPDAILLDMMMPGVNGWDFLEQWRGALTYRPVPVIVVTAYGERMSTVELGVQAIFTKPSLTWIG